MKTILLFLLALVLAPSGVKAQTQWEPMADEAAIVESGRARFTVLTPEMIRIQYSARKKFEDRASFAVVNRKLDVPAFTTEEADGYLYIRTEKLTLRYKLSGIISDANPSPDVLQITFNMNGKEKLWYPGKDDALNLKGTSRTLDGDIGDTHRVDLENGLLSRDGWAILDESYSATRGDGSKSYVFDEDIEGVQWWARPVDTTAIDWYFLGYGHEYKKALGDYVKIAGREPMPPLYMFGYWYSKYQAYSSTQFQSLVREMENNDIPHDVMIFDMDWHKSGWTGWTWNTSLIPNPKSLLSWMHNHDMKVGLNLHPADGVASYEDGYSAIAADMGVSGNQSVLWQIENPTFYIAFQVMPEHIHGLVYLKPGNRRHLGQIVQGFMIGCTHAYWDTLGIPWRDMTYQKGVRTPQYNDRHHTRSYRGPALFVRGYNDVQAITAEEVAIKIAYIRSNPERRIIKQQRPDIFCIHSNQQTHSWTEACLWTALCSDHWLGTHTDEARNAWLSIAPKLPRPEGSPQEPTASLLPLVYVGDKALLGAKRKVSLICHRADSALFEQQREAVLTAARSGAVVVSAFISPKEREIMKQLMTEQLPIIEILDNGISERYKPGGKSFYATAERRLVQISPWQYIYSRNTRVSRPMCLIMNELARIISGCDDGWWKGK